MYTNTYKIVKPSTSTGYQSEKKSQKLFKLAKPNVLDFTQFYILAIIFSFILKFYIILPKVIQLRFLKFSLIYATGDTFVYISCLRLYEKIGRYLRIMYSVNRRPIKHIRDFHT